MSNGYVDQFGNWIYTGTSTTGGLAPATLGQPYPAQDWRDSEINRLNMDLVNKTRALSEAYCEIGRLHEQIRGMTAFDKWSEGMMQKNPTP